MLWTADNKIQVDKVFQVTFVLKAQDGAAWKNWNEQLWWRNVCIIKSKCVECEVVKIYWMIGSIDIINSKSSCQSIRRRHWSVQLVCALKHHFNLCHLFSLQSLTLLSRWSNICLSNQITLTIFVRRSLRLHCVHVNHLPQVFQYNRLTALPITPFLKICLCPSSISFGHRSVFVLIDMSSPRSCFYSLSDLVNVRWLEQTLATCPQS